MNTIRKISLLFTTLFLAAGLAMSTYAQNDEYALSQAELDQVLAPIALYPDTVLSHILIAATYPLEVVEAERWSQKNPNLSGNKAVDSVENKAWDPSIKALTAFPQILKKMSEDLPWMQTLGDAFLQNEELVLSSVQTLRQRANDNGALNDLDHMEVVKNDGNIVLESRVKEIVYVPYYDTRVVYGPWWWNNFPPVYWSGFHTGISFFWGPRIRVGSSIYFSSFHWNRRHVVVVNRPLHSRYRLYSGRQVARHSSSKRWAHNPSHRRGVNYRSRELRDRYHNSRASNSRSSNSRYTNRNIDKRDTSKRYSNQHVKIKKPAKVAERLRQQRDGSIHKKATEKRKASLSTQRQIKANRDSKSNNDTRKISRYENQRNTNKNTSSRYSKERSDTNRNTENRNNERKALERKSKERTNTTSKTDKQSRRSIEKASSTTSQRFRASNSSNKPTRQASQRTERTSRFTNANRTSRSTQTRSNYSQRKESRTR